MKLVLAPMATLSHAAFRCLVENFGGCDEYFNEMINAPTLLSNPQFEKFYLDSNPSPQKIVWQLTGKNKESIIEASKIIVELSGIGLDLNMGCCAPDIVKSGAGISWMLKDSSETKALVCGVKNVLQNYETKSKIHKRLSVKCRLGDENFCDEEFFDFCRMLLDSGTELITLHPRTKKQRYRDKPRYKYAESLANIAKNYNAQVYVNGDIFDKSSLKNVSEICPSCDGVMIARAACQKPWIFKELKNALSLAQSEPISIDLLETALFFLEKLQIHQPQEFYKTRMNRFFTYYSQNFTYAHYEQSRLLNCKTIDEVKNELQDYFAKVPEDRILSV